MRFGKRVFIEHWTAFPLGSTQYPAYLDTVHRIKRTINYFVYHAMNDTLFLKELFFLEHQRLNCRKKHQKDITKNTGSHEIFENQYFSYVFQKIIENFYNFLKTVYL